MEKPKCQLCGNRHYSYEPCQWNDEPKKAKKRQSSKERVKRWQKKNREAYNAKMREYRRRKKAKNGSDPSPPPSDSG